MYETFFAFKERPFTAAPRADRYVPAASIEAARRTVERCTDRAEGIAMLIGPPGAGKSVVGHLLVKRFQSSLTVVFLQHGKFRNSKALLQAILFELRLPYRDMEEGELRLALQDFLRTTDRCPNGLLLVVDESHSLSVAQLEELHMLSLQVGNGQPRVRLVLLGGAGLEEKLTSPRLDAFSQRIVARCYLEALSLEETQAYVRTQLAAVGGSQALFTADAMTSLHQATDGIPRLINQVCDHALVLAFAGGRKRIDAQIVEEAWADLQQLPSPWSDGRRGVEGDAAIASPTIIEFGRLEEDDSITLPAEELQPMRPAIHAWYGDLEQDEPAETLTAIEH
jgi:general secretion pathway protein A